MCTAPYTDVQIVSKFIMAENYSLGDWVTEDFMRDRAEGNVIQTFAAQRGAEEVVRLLFTPKILYQ